MSSPLVHMSAVTKHFGAKQVLAGLDWQIAPGQVVGLLGRNGAGKSTLLECLLGLRELDGGRVALFGEAPDDLSDQARARIGYVPQKTDLFDWLTPLQMFDYFRALYPRWNQGKVEGLLSRWNFDAAMRNKPIKKLSGGEQQRLAIIRALAHDPALLILDEPVASLDPVGRRDFLRELVEQVIERGTTVVFSTPVLIKEADRPVADDSQRRATLISDPALLGRAAGPSIDGIDVRVVLFTGRGCPNSHGDPGLRFHSHHPPCPQSPRPSP
jgi:ABC-2 type transport system ATP-binding protein